MLYQLQTEETGTAAELIVKRRETYRIVNVFTAVEAGLWHAANTPGLLIGYYLDWQWRCLLGPNVRDENRYENMDIDENLLLRV